MSAEEHGWAMSMDADGIIFAKKCRCGFLYESESELIEHAYCVGAEEAEPNVYGEGNTNQPDFNALLDSWEAEIDEHSKAGEFGIAEGLRVASDELIALLRPAPDLRESKG